MKRLLIILGLFWGSFTLQAGTTGKISGVVRDAETGEALPGTNIIIEGTNLGAAADADGFYFIINVPPGIYQLKATMMGYDIQRQVALPVSSDQTTHADFLLKTEVLEGAEVVVVAERPPIQKDLTSSQQSFAAGEITAAPIQNLAGLIDLQAGINALGNEASGYVSGAPGDGLHIRGGRENETLFLIDGVKVGDDIYGGSRYIQHTSGGTVEEMKTIIGTFNAEYGGKMAGVISVVTKDGKDHYSGKLRGYTDKFGMAEFDRNTYELDGNFNGPVPFLPQLTFYLDGQIRSSDGRSDVFGVDLPNWRDSKGQIDRFQPGTKVHALWRDEWNAMLKFTYKPAPGLKLTASYFHDWQKRGKYKHEYRYVPYSFPWLETENNGVILKMVHTLNSRTFYELMTSYQQTDFFYGLEKIRERKILYGSRVTSGEYYYSGAPHDYNTDSSRTWQAVLNLTSQITNRHQIKTGFELRHLNIFHRMDMAGGSPVQEIDNEIYETHIAYSERNPIEFAAYFQDKMEFENIGMIMNAGVRFEYWDPRLEYMENPDLPLTTELLETEQKIRISPRFGISYPVSDVAAFHLAYGHFYQLPRYMELVSGINDRGYFAGRPNLSDAGPGISNANAKPEKTVSYETGVQFQLAAGTKIDVTTFYREMADLMGVRWMDGGGGYIYLDNVDFGNSKGVEMMLSKRLGNVWSARINYTWSTTHISTSSPQTAAQKNRFMAYRTFLADWDRPHNFSALLLWSLNNQWNVSLTTSARSGRPYSVLAEVLNTERMPWELTTDVRLSRYLKLLGFEQMLYFQVSNLFDRRNILSVYELTGKWDDDGLYSTPPDFDADPTRISEGRTAQLGVKVNF